MNKHEIAQLLEMNHLRFEQQLKGLPDNQYYYSPVAKWNAAQHLDHIIKSVKPVSMALSIPAFILQWSFGTANRPSRTYTGLVDKYNQKLSEGYTVSARFSAGIIPAGKRDSMLAQLTHLIKRLSQKTIAIDEASLDKYILPHPLLGKLTLREMLYFTAYHVNHHALLVEKGLEGFQPGTP